MDIHGVGKMFVDFFDEKDYYHWFTSEHVTQNLTDSNKTGFSYRKGLYLSNVEEKKDGLHFNFMRCSTNFVGPTENFTSFDKCIMDKVNSIAKDVYPEGAALNHALAQIYHNQKVGNKDRRAKISRHADKTKDMKENGLIVFCTFYDLDRSKYRQDPEDKNNLLYGKNTALTSMRFKLKESVVERKGLKEEFDVLLYPNSAMFIDLRTNRLYTHEIVPPNLPTEHVPTRLGYVLRSSETEAVHRDGKTYIKNDSNQWSELREPTDADMALIKKLYFDENTTSDVIKYGFIGFSLNKGDFLAPIVNPIGEKNKIIQQ